MRRAHLFIYLFIYLLLLFIYFPLVCCCYRCCCCCCFCFAFWFLLFHSFKQALHNKPPTHLGGNYSRIVFQPRFYSRNMAFGTDNNYQSKNEYCILHCLQCRYHAYQKLENSHSGCKWRIHSGSLCPFWNIHNRNSLSVSIRRYLLNIDNQQTLKRQKTKHKQLEIRCSSIEFNRPFYSYGRKRGWNGPCFDITIRFLLL